MLPNIRALAIKLLKCAPTIESRIQLARIKRVTAGDGYPDWKRILGNQRFISETHKDESPRKKVLLGTSIGLHLAAMQMESTLAVALGLRQADVNVLLCDAVLPSCQMCELTFISNPKRLALNGPSKDLCNHCFPPGRRVYEEANIPVRTYSQTLSAEDHDFAKQVSANIVFEEIEKYKLNGLKLGEHAKAGALRYFARATLDGEQYGEPILRRYLEAAILTALSVSKLFEIEHYDVVVFHHGIYVPQGIIGEVARQKGVRVVNWNPAYRKNSFIFSHHDTYHHTLMYEPVSVWENLEWTAEREESITKYLRSRWQGENDWIRFTENPFFEKERIFKEIGCDTNRPIIGCLTNVMWDAQLHYPANAFPNMLDWLLFTINYFSNRPDLQLVIRIHPAEIRGSVPTKQPVEKEIEKFFPKLPSNVFVIPPESNVSTYVLAELCDSVIIYGTKTGVELTSVGIPVIVAGEAWIRNKGVTIDAESIENYEGTLNKLPLNKRLSTEVVKRAKKYAYHFFFRRMISVEVFEKGPGFPPYRFNGDLTDIQYGSDSGLDCITNGILTGQAFIFDK